VAARSERSTVFDRSGTGIDGSNPTGDINVCPCFFSACVGLVGRMPCDEPIPIQRGYHKSKNSQVNSELLQARGPTE
jgi:hypothetical protein